MFNRTDLASILATSLWFAHACCIQESVREATSPAQDWVTPLTFQIEQIEQIEQMV